MISSYFGSEDTDDMEIQTLRERSDMEEEGDLMAEEMEVDSDGGEDEDKIPEEQDLESISTSDRNQGIGFQTTMGWACPARLACCSQN